MIMAMEEGREVDILQEVMRYSGWRPENTRFRVFSSSDRAIPVPRGQEAKCS